jgi:hypothetical protein
MDAGMPEISFIRSSSFQSEPEFPIRAFKPRSEDKRVFSELMGIDRGLSWGRSTHPRVHISLHQRYTS